eukprot:CAMPEP_0167754454 /NCGR_PEP_ID=MMETSP0110_2-20121227/8275_1 /TAXON_ID=629695 /ORGANISM="Gymnochlora sp., Strain CCMP2014" /LENGTH=439 /DNA_ID=CAMNT_0007640327 /DNA_START=19 /DNA_END=1338 /DNA_ORIENTATION=-
MYGAAALLAGIFHILILWNVNVQRGNLVVSRASSPFLSVRQMSVRRVIEERSRKISVKADVAPMYHGDVLPPPGAMLVATTLQGITCYPEVRSVDTKNRLMKVALWGEIVNVTESDQEGIWNGDVVGWDINPKDEWVSRFPLLSEYIVKSQSKVTRRKKIELQDMKFVTTLADFEERVERDLTSWTQGKNSDQRPSPVDKALDIAGDLLTLLKRQRGVSLIQLCTLWGVPIIQEPVYRPFVTTLLKRASANDEIAIITSHAVGGLGLSAIFSPKQYPYLKYAAHLASFGCQAAIVADSAYYKILIGVVLGYTRENIRDHVFANQNPNEIIDDEKFETLFELVDKELKQLPPVSSEKPDDLLLPWDPSKNLPSSESLAYIKEAQIVANKVVGSTKQLDSSYDDISRQEDTAIPLEDILKKRSERQKKRKGKPSGSKGFGG